MASSPPSPAETELLSLPSASESQLASLVYDLSHQANVAMENMLKLITDMVLCGQCAIVPSNLLNFNSGQQICFCTMHHCHPLVLGAHLICNWCNACSEVDQNSSEVQDEIGKCREFSLEKKRTLEEEKEHFQKAAYAVINILNNQEIS